MAARTNVTRSLHFNSKGAWLVGFKGVNLKTSATCWRSSSCVKTSSASGPFCLSGPLLGTFSPSLYETVKSNCSCCFLREAFPGLQDRAGTHAHCHPKHLQGHCHSPKAGIICINSKCLSSPLEYNLDEVRDHLCLFQHWNPVSVVTTTPCQ